MLLQFNSLGERVVVVAATNRIGDIDQALLRRFERKSYSVSSRFACVLFRSILSLPVSFARHFLSSRQGLSLINLVNLCACTSCRIEVGFLDEEERARLLQLKMKGTAMESEVRSKFGLCFEAM